MKRQTLILTAAMTIFFAMTVSAQKRENKMSNEMKSKTLVAHLKFSGDIHR